jgi:hypothetical protein
MESKIVVVSGLPRCGTSLMMQMLDHGGIEVITDEIRTPDTDNPRGYYEFEQVKKIKEDASWLATARGKAFKMVSQLLYELPASEQYLVIFMERDAEEMLISQEKMLARLNRPVSPRDQIQKAFAGHLEKLREWLARQANMEVLYVNYNELMERPDEQTARVSKFLGGKADAGAMARSIDPALYRNRRGEEKAEG